jgi:hypothetical protein
VRNGSASGSGPGRGRWEAYVLDTLLAALLCMLQDRGRLLQVPERAVHLSLQVM